MPGLYSPAAAVWMLATLPLAAQQSTATPVGAVETKGVTLTGVLHQGEGLATLGNNGSVTAGETSAHVLLARGGQLQVCTGTTVHIAKAVEPHAMPRPGDAGLMLSLDRGALEGHYTPGAFADEILTPDLRLLVSAPGLANFSMRVNATGDTCFDNAGADAPYVVVSSLMNGGVYRIQPGQRVLFVHGSLSRVIDNEPEPCGCPPDTTPEMAQTGGADNQFPLAVSEGLKLAPRLSGPPIVPEGVAHAQVTATLSSSAPPGAPPQPAKPPHRSFFHRIGHLLARVFGAA